MSVGVYVVRLSSVESGRVNGRDMTRKYVPRSVWTYLWSVYTFDFSM
jgi:hypothetical protein